VAQAKPRHVIQHVTEHVESTETESTESLKALLWLHFLIRELLKILVEMHLKVKLPSLVQHFL